MCLSRVLTYCRVELQHVVAKSDIITQYQVMPCWQFEYQVKGSVTKIALLWPSFFNILIQNSRER